MSKAQEMYDLLAREGYRPTLEDGEHETTVFFKCQGDRMSVQLSDNDPSYVYLRAFYTIEGYDRGLALAGANQINVRYKVVKATLAEERDVVTFSIECWYSEIEHLAPHLDRWLRVMMDASNEYFGRLRAGAPAPREGVV